MGKAKQIKSKIVLAAAAVPAIGFLLPTISSAASVQVGPTATLTSEGAAADDFGDTTTGFTGYVLTINADPGDVITEITAGQTTSDANGIFGTFLQDFVPGRGTNTTSTPVAAGSNNSDNGIDTHFLTTNTLNVTAPFEDSNGVHPAGAPANDTQDSFGTGTFLRGVFGLPGASSPSGNAEVANLPLAYLVIPNSSASVNVNLSVAEAPTTGPLAGQSVSFPVVQTLSTSGTPTPTPTATIVSLVAGTTPGAGFSGTQLTTANATFSPNQPVANSINVQGKSGSYSPGFATLNNAGGITSAYVETSGFTPATDTEVYALALDVGGTALSPTDSRVATIVNDINASSATDGVTASALTGMVAGAFPGYDVLLTSTGTGAAQDLLNFNFANETNVANVTVASIAAVPEPASMALLTLGAAGLLAGRRKRAL